ncbi:serine/threonine-protein kinase [Ideonella sp. DXS29W]|uniref:Serine/threonine-protein kinase n=1 Tax=Ideonella lacteola TaxID=2984193 RepID=A0ABU9BSF6_9BURK
MNAASGAGHRDVPAPEEAAASAWLGRRVGAYRLVRLIGRGGMGRVFMAERADGQFEQRVAVKLVREGIGVPGLHGRFRAEQQILASLDHPNLAKIIDGGITDDGVPYFVMELVEGEPIDAYCEQRELPLAERLRLFRSVCQVVHYAHTRGVVHRDLKPANILVGAEGAVKLVDFGIARRLDTDNTASPETGLLRQAMTLEYASPEQVRGEAATPASDVFSLGAVLHRLLTGAGPYPALGARSAYELARAICEDQPVPPSRAASTRAWRRQLRGDLDAVVLMALRKEPSHRYGSAELLADDVFRCIEGLPVRARGGAWSYRAARFVMRHRVAVAGALAVSLAMVAGLGLATYRGLQARAERERAQQNFDSVRKLSNVFMFDVYKQIEFVPGSLQARTMLLDTALAYLKKLNAESQGDASLQLEIAEGYANIGDIQGGLAANLGDNRGALASFDQAMALVRPLMEAASPWQAQARAQFVSITAKKGGLLMASGAWKEAEAIEREGLRVAQDMAAAAPSDVEVQRRLVTQMSVLARLYLRSGRVADFDAMHAEYLRSAQSLFDSRPNDPDLAADLGAALIMRAVNLMQNVATPESRRAALGEYQKAVQLLEPLYQKNPLHTKVAATFGRAHGYMGHLYVLLLEPKLGLEHLGRAVEVAEAVAAIDPKDVHNRKELAEAHGRLAQAHFELLDPEAAVKGLRRSLEVFDGLPEVTQDEVTIQYNRGMTHHLIGQAMEAAATPLSMRSRFPARSPAPVTLLPPSAEACEHYRTANAMIEANLQRRPNNAMVKEMASRAGRSLERCSAASSPPKAVRSAASSSPGA